MSNQGEKRFHCLLLVLIVLGGWIFQGCRSRPSRRSICEIQGKGSLSPYQGSAVLVEGIISADFGDQNPPGFYLEGNCPENGDSRDIWIVLDDDLDWIALGDEIRLEGVVEERNLETVINTRADSIEILSLSNLVSDPINLADIYNLDPFSFSYEELEGELVLLPESLLLAGSVKQSEFIVSPVFNRSWQRFAGWGLEGSFFLGVKGALTHPGLGKAAPGDQISNIQGILRQDLEGYYIHVFNPAGILVRFQTLSSPDLPLVLLEQVSAQGPILSGTETAESPSPSPPFPIMPTSSATQVPSPTYYSVNLLLTEIHPNPKGEEPELEWVEIYNPENYGIPLTGVKLGDEVSSEGREGTLRFPDGYYIEAGEVLVIANSGSAFLNWYGFFPDFEMYASDNRVPEMLPYSGWGGNKIRFSNSGDEVLLIDPWDQVIDQLAYGKSSWAGFAPPVDAPREGHSLERYPAERDRDIAGDWRERQGGSPGWLDRSPPTAVATQTQVPSPTSTIIILPSSSSSVTISYTITPFPSHTITPSPSHTITPSPPHTITPFPSHIITPFPSHTITPSPPYTISPSPIPSATPSPSLPVIATPSPTLPVTASPTFLVTPSPSHTITSSPIPTGTPSPSHTITSTPSPALVINEIHADPHPMLGDANNDGEVHSDNDEFLELVNVGEKSLDLGGWQVQDLIKTRFVFPEGTILNGGCGLVIFGGEVSVGLIEGSQVFSTGSLALNNSGDTIYLIDQDHTLQITLSYGPEGGEDQSLTLFPDLFGQLPYTLHSEVIESNGRLFSPGTRVDGTVFGDCP